MLPRQNVSEKEKQSKQWLKECVDSIVNAFHRDYYKRVRDLLVYNILQGNLSDKKYEYITKEFGKEYPVKLKNYPLIRPVVNTALGEETEQEYRFHVKRIDEEGLQIKSNAKQVMLFQMLLDDLADKLEKGIKLEPINERAFEEYKSKVDREFLDDLEVVVTRLLNYFENNLDFKHLRTLLFASIIETGKCFWVYEEGAYKSKIGVRVIPAYNLVYAQEENVEFLSDASWVCERMFLTKEQILDKYGSYLEKEDREKLEKRDNRYYTLLGDYYDFEKIRQYYEEAGYVPNYYILDTADKIEVYVGQWKSIRKYHLAEIESKHDERLKFVKLLDEKEAQKKKGAEKQEKYIQELYEFVRIGSDIYVWNKTGKSKIQIRHVDNPYYVKLHYEGLWFHIDNTGEEFSLVWYLKDLQELYNILNYHRERMIALSGVKGVVYDISQLPRNVELHELLYYRKLGLLIIDSSLGQGQFNQFQSYNDSLDASIGILTQMLEDIRNEVDRVSGFNRQRQGQMFQKDLVGQIENAIRQGSYSTAVLYYFQTKVYKTLLEGLLNYAKNYFYYENKRVFHYVSSEGKEEVFYIDRRFTMADYGVFMSNHSRDNRYFEELKALTKQMLQSNAIKASDAIKLLKVNNIAELENKLLANIEKAEAEMKRLQEAQAQQPDKEVQLKMQELQAKMQIEQMKLKETKEIKLLELQQMREQELSKATLQKERLEIDKKYKEDILKLKQELLSLERKEYEVSVQRDTFNKSIKGRSEIKNVV